MSQFSLSNDNDDSGRLKIHLNSCYLHVKVTRPYVIITMGDQIYQTSISEYPDGKWNEGFEFSVSYHAQLFDTIQLDVYDSYMILPDRHVGRAEIRLIQLQDMPATFTSFYEVWDKKLSTGASSHAVRKTTMATNVGALQATISYRFLHIGDPQQQQQQQQLQQTEIDRQPMEDDLIFRKHLQQNRDTADILFHKYEEGAHANMDQLHPGTTTQDHTESQTTSSSSANTMIGSLGSWFGKGTASTSLGHPTDPTTDDLPTDILNDLDSSLKTYPLLDTLGSWTVSKETNQILRAIGKLLAAFGQGFELSNLQMLSGFAVVERFYQELPREQRTWDIVKDLSEIQVASHLWRYSMASYGWKGLNFIGKGNGYLSDAIRHHSDSKSVMEHLSLPPGDLLAYEFRNSGAFRPSYFVAHDPSTNSIVLSIRGTMSAFDTMTDLVCDYEPWKGGMVHKGMKTSAMWFFHHLGPKLIAYCNRHSIGALYIVGHSLGAATASLLTIMLLDYMDELQKGQSLPFTLQCFGYAPACCVSLDLAEKYKNHIQSIVFADDVVSKLCYGTMMDLKQMIIAGAEAAQNLGISQFLWTGTTGKEKWKSAFEQVAECRQRCIDSMENPRLYVAGKVYQFWLDPTPKNPTRIVVERTSPKRVSSELILKASIIMDHLPTNFDIAFRRATESMMTEPKEQQDGVLDQEEESRTAEQELKHTSKRGGTDGSPMIDEQYTR